MFSFMRDRSITNETARARNAPAQAAPSTSAASRLPMRMTARPAPMKSPPSRSQLRGTPLRSRRSELHERDRQSETEGQVEQRMRGVAERERHAGVENEPERQ